jgi:hypothetical protein
VLRSPLKLLVQARRFDAMLVSIRALNIIVDLHPGIFMPNVSFDYKNSGTSWVSTKTVTLPSVTCGS